MSKKKKPVKKRSAANIASQIENVVETVAQGVATSQAAQSEGEIAASGFDTSTTVQREFVPSSLIENTRFAMRVARKIKDVDDSMTDNDALRGGIITPELIELIISIVNDLMQNCFSNNARRSWDRVSSYVNATSPMDRMGDNVRLGWIIDRWMVRSGARRDRGDVTEYRNAIASVAAELKESDFIAVQDESLFLTV